MFLLLGSLLGAIFGSFSGALLSRSDSGHPNWVGRSSCDSCGLTLRVAELIPILSFIVLRGRCRRCHASIDHVHVTAEIASSLAGGLLAMNAISLGAACFLIVFGCALAAVALFDIRYFRLPDLITIPLIGLGLLSVFQLPEVPIQSRLLGAAAGYLLLTSLRLAYRSYRGREGIGAGDAKLLAAIGAWLGLLAVPWILIAAAFLGFCLVGFRRARGRSISWTDRLPLGALISIAAVAAAQITYN